MSSDWHLQTPRTFVQHLINHGFARHRPITSYDDFDVYELDLTQLKLNLHWFTPFVVPKRLPHFEDVPFTQLRYLWNDVEMRLRQRQRIIVLLVNGHVHLSQADPGLEELNEKGVVIWDQRTMQAIADTADPEKSLRRISKALLDTVGRSALSPYLSGRPAVGGRFFGRSTQLRQFLSDDSNCTIIGNRRIGKTSLLKEIKERLKLRGYRTAEIYGATVKTTVDFVFHLLNELGEYRQAQQVLKNNYHVTSLPRWIKQMAAKDPVAVFVDELDHILEFDAQQEFSLIHTLRSIFESNSQCRIFFAGFRRVMKEKQSARSPLYNFTKTVELQGFSREETYEMVTRPLAQLGIDVTDTDLPTQIYLMTTGHPEHIQICCSELIGLYEENNKLPQTGELLARVLGSPEYKQKVMGAFLSNTNPLEELLCYLLVAEATSSGQHQWYEFRPRDVDRVLEAVGVGIPLRGILSMLTNLVVSGIVRHIPGEMTDSYRLSSPLLITYLANLDLEFCVKKVLETIREHNLADVYYTRQSDSDFSTEP